MIEKINIFLNTIDIKLLKLLAFLNLLIYATDLCISYQFHSFWNYIVPSFNFIYSGIVFFKFSQDRPTNVNTIYVIFMFVNGIILLFTELFGGRNVEVTFTFAILNSIPLIVAIILMMKLRQ